MLGISEAQVSSRLALLADPEVREKVERREISAITGREKVRAKRHSADGRKTERAGKREVSGKREHEDRVSKPDAKSGIAEDPLSVLDGISSRLERLLKQVGELPREDKLSMGIDTRTLERALDRIVDQVLRLRRSLLR